MNKSMDGWRNVMCKMFVCALLNMVGLMISKNTEKAEIYMSSAVKEI